MSSRCSRKLPSLRRAAATIESRASSAVARRRRTSLSPFAFAPFGSPRTHTCELPIHDFIHESARPKLGSVRLFPPTRPRRTHRPRLCIRPPKGVGKGIGKPTKVKRAERVFVLGNLGPFGTICRALRCVNGKFGAKRSPKDCAAAPNCHSPYHHTFGFVFV